MNDTPEFNPLSDPDVRRVNGRVAALQARLDQVNEGLRMSRAPFEFLHRHGLAETERTIGREMTAGMVSALAAWAFATLELADMRAGFEEAELIADELRRKAESEQHNEGEEWEGG